MKKILKKVYDLLPFKSNLFAILRLFKPPHRIYQHLYFKGEFIVFTPSGHFTMKHYGYELENELFWRGLKGWEKVSVDVWMKLAKRSKNIYDVGANTGVFALIAASENPQAQVYAFEPLRRVYEKMKTNVELNSHMKIKPFDLAISNRNGEAVFYDTLGEHSYSASLNPDHRKTGIEVRVQSITLDKFLSDNHLPVDLIKIDVERFEAEVIEGFMESIRKYQPAILIEILDKEIGEKIQAMIKDVPYVYFSIDEVKGVRKVDHLSKSDGFNYLICKADTAMGIGLQ